MRGFDIFTLDMMGYVWYNRGDTMKRGSDVRRLVKCACVRWLDRSLSCAHVAVLMSLSWWLMSLPFGCAYDLGKIIVENFLSILLPKSFDFCLELCYDICVKRKEISLVWIDG